MARPPDEIIFFCEGCRNSATPSQLRRWNALCQHCMRESSWTLIASYTDTETQTTAFGVASALMTGIQTYQFNEYTNTLQTPEVPNDVVRFLTSERKLVNERVSEYLSQRSRQDQLRQGALECKQCSATFMAAEKSWHEKGFCSRLCAAQAGAEGLDAPKAVKERPKDTVEITCGQGHSFNVLSTFSGCLRPCPECGEKTPVP